MNEELKVPKAKIEITDIDKQGFKFLAMLQQPEFAEFLKWVQMIRDRVNRVDGTLPTLMLNPSKNECEAWGIMLGINRAKISMLDDLIVMMSNLRIKYDSFIKEADNG